MAGRIKGITVEIGGDTTKLQTALKAVNSEIKNTQAQLKDVEKLLKLDPGNTELLAQRQRLLGDAVSETKQKLETLKLAAEQANQALANGDISQEQYDALQREIAETEQALRRLEDQANQSATALQKIAATGEKLKATGDKISSVGEKLLPVTGAVAALGTAAVKTASDFDSGMSRVAAVSGAAGDELTALRDKAREMGAKTKFSASEAADAMNYMAMAGWKTADMLGGIEGIMNLAAASGESLATTSDIVTDALTAFGLTASDSGRFADVLAAASSNANTNVSMMGETFKYCAPIAGALGFSIEDTAEAIGLMANAGIKSSQAGTALRTIMNNLTGEVTICGASLGEVTIATTHADGSMRALSDILSDCRTAFSGLSESEQAAAAEALVGKNAMSGFLALMNAAPADVEKLSGAIANCDGTAASMAATMQDNLAGQLTILKSQLEELAISFGELLMPAVRTIVGWIQSFVDVLNGMDEGTKKAITTIALLVAALGPVLIVIGKVLSAVGTIMTFVPKLATAFGALKGVLAAVKGGFAALSGVLLANPIVLVIAAIAALVAAFVHLWKNNEGFRQFWIDLWESIKTAAISAWQAISVFFTTSWEAISGTAQSVWSGVCDFFSGLWESIQTVFTTVVTAIGEFLSNSWNSILTTLSGVWNTIQTTAVTIWNGIYTTLEPLLTALQYLFDTIFQAIQLLVSIAFESIRNVATTIWNELVMFFTTALESLRMAFETVWNAISNAVITVLTAIQNAVTNIWNSIVAYLTPLLNGIRNTVQTIWTAIQTAISNITQNISSFVASAWANIRATVISLSNEIKAGVTNAFNSMKAAVSSTINGIVSTIRSGFNSAVSYIRGLASQAFRWGADIINGIINGIVSCIGRLSSAVYRVANTIRSVLHFSVPDEGPLTDFESWMPDFMKGLAQGIEKSRYLVSGAMDKVAADMVLSPQVGRMDYALAGIEQTQSASLTGLTAALQSSLSGMNPGGGDIVIPVYIGQERLDELVVRASQTSNYRSGGRSC